MTPLEDKLRAALRETAGEIPADPPPLRLRPRRASPGSARAPVQRGPAPLDHLGRPAGLRGPGRRRDRRLPRRDQAARPGATHGQPPAGPAGVPPYYVALVTGGAARRVQRPPRRWPRSGPRPPARCSRASSRPSRTSTSAGVTAAADDRTFVLVAEEKSNPPATVQQDAREYPFSGYYPPSRFFLLHIDPSQKRSATPGGRASLRALPAGFIPANDEVHDMALSPDGTLAGRRRRRRCSSIPSFSCSTWPPGPNGPGASRPAAIASPAAAGSASAA